MSAGGALQTALTGALGGEARLTGIYDGPPARAAFPYAVIDAGNESDWSHKNGEGREVLVALTVWDEEPVRLAELADAVEQLAAGVNATDGWSWCRCACSGGGRCATWPGRGQRSWISGQGCWLA